MTENDYIFQDRPDQPPDRTDFEGRDNFSLEPIEETKDLSASTTGKWSGFPPTPDTIGIFAGRGFRTLTLDEIIDSILPQELQLTPTWCVWVFEYDAANEKWKKRPFVPFRGQKHGIYAASANKPQNWVSIAQAFYAAKDDFEGRIEGIGRFFSANDPFVGIDLDYCLDLAGNLRPWAIPILAMFPGAYVEYSPSGRGLKLWTRGRLPGRGIKVGGLGDDGRGAVEIYDRDRYFTVTARPYGVPVRNIADRSAAVLALVEQLQRAAVGKDKSIAEGSARSRTTRPPLTSSGTGILSDEAVIKKCRKAYPEFSSLFDSGDRSPFSGDWSRADAALAKQIAFFSCGDRDQIERIFGRSALAQREKWTHRPEYREWTISSAIASLTKSYDPKH